MRFALDQIKMSISNTSSSSSILSALGLCPGGSTTLFVCDIRVDGGLHWHSASARTIHLDARGEAVLQVVKSGCSCEVMEVGITAARTRCRGLSFKFDSLSSLAHYACKGEKQRYFVSLSDSTFVVAHSIKLSESAAQPQRAVCRVFPGVAPYFEPFDIAGEGDILRRVTKRPPAFGSVLLDHWAAQGRQGCLLLQQLVAYTQKQSRGLLSDSQNSSTGGAQAGGGRGGRGGSRKTRCSGRAPRDAADGDDEGRSSGFQASRRQRQDTPAADKSINITS
jgi:hypothetical protein